MIKINLLQQKKDSIKIPLIMGIDLTKISWVGIILSGLLVFGAHEGIGIYFKKELGKSEAQVKKINKKIKKIKKDIRKHSRIKEMLNEFEIEKKKLRTKTQHVAEILENKSNPKKILERLARDISKDIWLKHILIKDGSIRIAGIAYNYLSIGDFTTKLNQSKFFGRSLRIVNEKVKTETFSIRGRIRNMEHFELQGRIISYE